MVGNNKTISTLAASPSEGLQDGTDAIHSGVIKGLESFAYDRMIIEHGGFAISSPGGSTLNTVTLTQPIKYMFDGKMHSYGTNLTVNTVAAHGTHTRYDWVVLDYNDGGTPHIEIIQGTAASTPKVSDFNSDATNFDKFIPVALIAMVGGSDNGAARSFQMYTLDKNNLSLTVADEGASAGTLVEAMSITSASGVVTFASQVEDADVIFRVNDGNGTSGDNVEVMRFDASKSQVTIGGESNSEATLHVRNNHTTHGLIIESTEESDSSAPDITLYRNSSSPADGDDLAIILFRGRNDASQSIDYASILAEIDDASDSAEGGQMRFKTYIGGSNRTWLNVSSGTSGNGLIEFNPDGLGSIDFRIESDNSNEAFFLDSSADHLYINKVEAAFTTSIHNDTDVVMSVTSAGVVFNDDGNTGVDFVVESNNYNVINVDSSNDSIAIGSNDSAKIGFYAATPIVTPVLDAATMGAGESGAENAAKITEIANALVSLGLCNIA